MSSIRGGLDQLKQQREAHGVTPEPSPPHATAHSERETHGAHKRSVAMVAAVLVAVPVVVAMVVVVAVIPRMAEALRVRQVGARQAHARRERRAAGEMRCWVLEGGYV